MRCATKIYFCQASSAAPAAKADPPAAQADAAHSANPTARADPAAQADAAHSAGTAAWAGPAARAARGERIVEFAK